MKVLHVNTHMNIGGIGQYIISTAKALKSMGIECIVASGGGDLESGLEQNGIRHFHLDIRTKSELSPKVFIAVPRLIAIIKKEKVDIVHAHTRVSQVVSFFASRNTGVPYVTTCHGYFKKRLFRRLFDTWGAKVIAISDAVSAHLKEDFGINKKRIELIYNGVDISKFSIHYAAEDIAKAKKELKLGEGPVIGTVGRLSPVKGHRTLIEAMRHVVSDKKNAQCLIIGRGREEASLKALAKDVGIERSARFISSNYPDMPLCLSCMDIFVLPSVKEGLGLALLEAMSAGRPCIGSNIGGIADIIKDRINGLLVPVGDPAALAAAILNLLDDRVLSERLARQGSDTVKEKFSLDTMAGRIARLYEEVLNA